MTATVLAFPERAVSTFNEAWACRQGMMKRRGDGLDKTRKLWERHAKKVGSQELLAALKRYLREEKEPTCGYPGLSVWLNGERYDHWLTTDLVEATGQPVKKAPESLRTTLLGRLGEPFVRSYLDPCTFHEDGYITPATDYAKGKLMEVKGVLKAAGLVGMKKRV